MVMRRWMGYLVLLVALMPRAAVLAKVGDQPAKWGVKADPPSAHDKPLATKPDLQLHQAVNGPRSVVTSGAGGGGFVLTTSNYLQGGWELWDLHKGSKTGGGSDVLELDNALLSSDGKFVGGSHRDDNHHLVFQAWSLQPYKKILEQPGGEAATDLNVIGFADQRVFVLARRFNKPSAVTEYALPGGAKVQEISPPNVDKAMVTPGGNYVAVRFGARIDVYDMASGQIAGTLDIDKLKLDGEEFSAINLANMAFSPDGRELALFFCNNARTIARIEIFDMSNGVCTADGHSEVHLGGFRGTEFSYLPDGSGWLVGGNTVIMHSVMAAVYAFGEPVKETPFEKVSFACMTSPSQLLEIVTDNNLVAFRSRSIPPEQLKRTLLALSAGGSMEDGDLPPLTVADGTAAPGVSLEDAPAAPWKFQAPATMPVVTKISPTPIAIRAEPLPEEGGGFHAPEAQRLANCYDDIAAIMFTSAKAGTVVIEHAVGEVGQDPKPYGRKVTWVERYDMANGKMQAGASVPGTMQLQDASPSGKLIVLRTGTHMNRIDVMSEKDGTFKPLAAFRPFVKEPPVHTEQGMMPIERQIQSAVLPDDSHLLTLSNDGILIGWELPSCHPLWRAKVEFPEIPADARFIALSPDRSIAALSLKTGLVLFNPQTGAAVNAIDAQGSQVDVGSIAFTPDGASLAIMIKEYGGYRIQMFDLASGTKTQDIPLWKLEASAIRNVCDLPLSFPQNGYVLMGPYLLSLEKKALVWQYNAPMRLRQSPVRYGPVLTTEQAWFAVSHTQKMSGVLVHTPLPHAAALPKIEATLDNDLYVWKPGGIVSLDVEVVGNDEYRQSQIAEWTKQLKEQGIKVVDGYSNIITAQTMIVPGDPVEYNVVATGEKLRVNPPLVQWVISLKVGNAEIWRSAMEKPPATTLPVMDLTLKPGETAQQAVARLSAAPAQASHIELPPTYIFKQRVLPSSNITAAGIEDRK